VLTGRDDLAAATQIVHDTFLAEPARPLPAPAPAGRAGTALPPATGHGRFATLPALAAAE
jgi:aspartate kinase